MTNPKERSFSEAMELASKQSVTDELRAVYSAYTDSQRRPQSTVADAERARNAYRTIENVGWTISWTHDKSFPGNAWPIDIIAAALSTARAEGIAQGRAEMREIDAAVIEAARATLLPGIEYECIRRRMLLRDALAARDRAQEGSET